MEDLLRGEILAAMLVRRKALGSRIFGHRIHEFLTSAFLHAPRSLPHHFFSVLHSVCGLTAVPLPEGIFFVSTQLYVLPVAGQCSPLVVSGSATDGSQREGDAALWRTRGNNSGRSSESTRAQG